MSVLRLTSILGSCPRCIRKSFRAAAAAWIATVITGLAASSNMRLPCVLIATGIAALLTALWIGHVAAVSARSVRYAQRFPDVVYTRRAIFPTFARIALFAAAASAAPRLVMAQQYTDSDCGPQHVNCGTRHCCVHQTSQGTYDRWGCCDNCFVNCVL